MTTPTRLRALASTAALTALLAPALTGCGGEVEIGEATTSVSRPSDPGTDAPEDADAPADPADEVPAATVSVSVVSSDLNQEPSLLGETGQVQLHLPLGWAAVEGSDMATAGETAVHQGGFRISSVPAEGRTADEWTQALMTDQTDLFDEEGGMESREPVTTFFGLTLFHLVQSYSDDRAHVLGTVVDDTLHLLRFGTDGSEAATEVIRASAETFELRP